MYFSILYSVNINKIQIGLAEKAKNDSEIELEAYKSKMNPELLNKSLETLICYAAKDPVLADDYISQISDFYRSILNNKRTELIDLKNELETAVNYIALQNSWNNDNIDFKVGADKLSKQFNIIPGTVYLFLEYVIHNSIISPILPLSINCKIDGDILFIECLKRDKIQKNDNQGFEIEQLNKAYKFYSDSIPEIIDKNGILLIKIPLFEPISKNK
ncbi:MAG: hypothetical protein B6I20_12230 [Bacteroidetes bacterium 4572_117]|nr:MAG: hypothetical protein B6I20_12230 [Bacteroidetes bacterium 4572_117]